MLHIADEDYQDFLEDDEAEILDDELFLVKCKRCGREISLANCDFDSWENSICKGGCNG